MNRTWRTAVASFYLLGFAGITTATAISTPIVSADARADGRMMMVDAQYRLAVDLRR